MSVVIETTMGDITVDLFVKSRPKACLNFLKLCKIKYYNYNLFHTVTRNFIAQTGDPTGSRTGGESIFGVMEGQLKRYFEAETVPKIKHTICGLISFVGTKENMIGSQFFITLASDLTYLDEQHCVFGQVVEGHEVLEQINEAICDGDDRPYQDIRITHTVILDDPFPDPDQLEVPERSPSPSAERLAGGRIAPDEDIDETVGKSLQEVNEIVAQREAKARATILEMVGDIPDADMAPPENVLFVCKLNPVTTDDDLEIIFSRFGKIKSCEVIRDKKTGDSLQYAFVEFEERKSCEDAYFKMDNVLIDDRRIHVDFSQSVAKIKWHGKGRGVTHYDDKGKKLNKHNKDNDHDVGKGNYKTHRNRNSNNDHSEHHKASKEEKNYDRKRDNRNSRYYNRYEDRENNAKYRSKHVKERDNKYRSFHPTDRRRDIVENSHRRRRSRSRSTERSEERSNRDSRYKTHTEKSDSRRHKYELDNRRRDYFREHYQKEDRYSKSSNKDGKRKVKKGEYSSSNESSSSDDRRSKKKTKKKKMESDKSSSDDSEQQKKRTKKKKRRHRSSSSSSSSES